MHLRSFFLFATIFIISATSIDTLWGQRRRTTKAPANIKIEDLPKRAIDTLSTSDPETFVITYSNNTWSYYRPELKEKFGGLKVYNEHWDTSQVFAYRSIQLDDLPAVIDLKLISSLDEFHPPIVGRVFSPYGWRGRRNHNGVDIPLATGEPIYATFDGRVRMSKYNTGGFGNLVILRHRNGLETWHAHLSKRNVESGDYVKAGQIIGYGGNTGRSRGPHLHFEVRYSDQSFDPQHLIDFESGQLKYQTFALEKGYFNINSRASDQLEEHDFDDLASINPNIEEITSEEILDYMSKASEKKQRPVAQGDVVYHTVRAGDMLGKIAIKYGVSIDQICRLNNIKRTTVLQLGRKLRVK